MSGPRILLVAADLMVGSRVAGLAGACNATVEQRRAADATGGPFDLAIVDVQALTEDAATVFARLRADCPADRPLRIVAFGPHVATQLLDQARAAGADDVVSRGELLGGFAAIVRRWENAGADGGDRPLP
jgi:CheY-like chemotaxis protein